MKVAPILSYAKIDSHFGLKKSQTFPKFNPSFDTTSFSFLGKTITISDESELKKEVEMTNYLRRYRVNTPKIDSRSGVYVVNGKRANFKTAPIVDMHIRDVQRNILLLDKLNVYHGNLSNNHVFYNSNGKVELDGFRFGVSKKESKEAFNSVVAREYPEEYGLSNLIDYENLSLGKYLEGIGDNERENSFIRGYLKISTDFHRRKADFLRKNSLNPQAIEFEELQAKLFKNPDDDLVQLTKDRIKFKYLESKALSGKARISDVKKSCGEYLGKIEKIKQETISDDKVKLLDYMALYATHCQSRY